MASLMPEMVGSQPVASDMPEMVGSQPVASNMPEMLGNQPVASLNSDLNAHMCHFGSSIVACKLFLPPPLCSAFLQHFDRFNGLSGGWGWFGKLSFSDCLHSLDEPST